jgi:hypothetical protein
MADFPVQSQQEKADASTAWLAANRPDLVSQQSTSASQAASINAAYMNNTLPVLPKMGTPTTGYNQNDTIRIYDTTGLTDPRNQMGVARDVTPAEYYQIYGRTPEQSEAAKYAEFNAPIDYSKYANVPLSQMPAGVASRVQDYYAAHPTERFQAITSQYAATKGIVENPYDPNTAAGIAWLSARQGTPVSASLGQKAIQQGYQGDLYAVSGISTVPTRDYSSRMLSGSKMVAALPGGTTTVYMPYGEYAQIEMKGAKALLDYQTGELGVYQLPYGRSSFMLTGGGGRAALQSGMFTIEKAETPYVISQEGVGTYALPSGAGLARLGAEAYGGVVRPLDDRTLAANEAISRYTGSIGKYNLANFVSQIPAGKAEVPGAKIPWSVETTTPALSYMDERGVIPGSAITIPGESGRLIGSKVIAGSPSHGTTEAGALPTPFISTSKAQETPSLLSSAGSWLAGAESYVAGITGIKNLSTPSTEQIKEMGKNPLFISTNPLFGVALQVPQTQEYAASFIRGEAVQLQTKPLESAVSYGVGFAGGIGWKGLEAVVGAGRAGAAEQIISKGGVWRAADIFAGGVMKYAPSAMGAIYAVDVSSRVTKGGTDFSPAAAERLGGLAVGEIIPGGMGFVHGYEAPGAAYNIAKTAAPSFEGIKTTMAGEPGITSATPRPEYTVRQLPESYIPEVSKMPSPEKNALLYGSIMDTRLGRITATDIKTGEIVGAAAFRTVKEPGWATLVVESVGSVKPGAGKSLVAEMQVIAGREGASTITGGATPSARGFWEKMGATVSNEKIGTTYPFEIPVSKPTVAETPFTGKTFYEQIRSSIPSLTQLRMKTVGYGTQDTAMGAPVASERFAKPSLRTTSTAGYYSPISTRANPALAKNVARTEFYAGRLASRPSSTPSAQSPYWKVMGAQPAETGGISMTGMGGEGKITGFVTAQSPTTVMKDMIPGKAVKVSEIAAKYEMAREKVTPPIYGEVTTKSLKGGAALASRVEMAPQAQVQSSVVDQSLSPRSMNAYQYQRSRGGYSAYESDFEYTQRTLPPGMKAPEAAGIKMLTEIVPKEDTALMLGLNLGSMQELQNASKSSLLSAQIPRSEMASKLSMGLVPITLEASMFKMGLDTSASIKNLFTQTPEEKQRTIIEPMVGLTPANIQRLDTYILNIQSQEITPITTQRTTTVIPPITPTFYPTAYPPTTSRQVYTYPETKTPYEIPVSPVLPTAFPLPPSFGGGGGSGFGRKRRRSFLEVFTMGLDIAGPVMKLTSPPKPRLPTKTGGSKAAKSMKGKWSKNIKIPKTKKK